MKQRIYDYLADHGPSTFADLDRDLEGFQGNEFLSFNGDCINIVWPSTSQAAVDALTELQLENKIQFDRCSPIHYMRAGKQPKIKTASADSHTTPRWHPVLIKLRHPQ